MRDHLVRLGPLFSAASSTARRPDNRSIDTPKFVIQLAGAVQFQLQVPYDATQRPILTPVVEVVVNRLPRTVGFRNVAPRRASPQNPQDGVEHPARIRWWSASRRRFGKMVFDSLPLLVRKFVSWHLAILHDGFVSPTVVELYRFRTT